jgi:integrase
VACGTAPGLAVSGPQSRAADDHASAQSRVPCRCGSGWDCEERVSPYVAAHFATHLLEQNTDIRVIQVLLGHAKLQNTALYARVATKTIQQVMSPLEHIVLKLKEIRPPS